MNFRKAKAASKFGDTIYLNYISFHRVSFKGTKNDMENRYNPILRFFPKDSLLVAPEMSWFVLTNFTSQITRQWKLK